MRSLLFWLATRHLDPDFIALTYDIDRGTATRMVEIDSAIPPAWIDMLSCHDPEAAMPEHDLQTG